MLKSSKETAKAAMEAAKRAKEEERSAQEAAEEKQRRRHELEQAIAEFEKLAIKAAIEGDMYLVTQIEKLDIGRLVRQGFIARKLQRRMPFEAHLQSLRRKKDEALSRLADHVVVEWRGVPVVGDDTFLHRNPLRSMLEAAWRRGDIVPPADVELLLAVLRPITSGDHSWHDRYRSRVEAVLRAFEELKFVENKLQQVTLENRLLGPAMQTGTYISWELSGDGAGMAVAFCPEKLKWLAVNWSELSSWIQEAIDSESAEGSFEAVFTFFENGEGQLMIGSYRAQYSLACGHPAVMMSEMQSAGYEAVLAKSDPEYSDGTPREIRFEEIDLALLDTITDYELRVSWGP